jgi:hypothetical protein
VKPQVNTSYSLVGANGLCTASTSANVSVIQRPNINITVSPAATICAGGTAVLNGGGDTTYTWSNGASGSSISVNPTTTTVYTLTGAGNGCSNSNTVVISVGGAGPVVLISSSQNSICAGGSTTLTASGATSYTWSNGSGNAVIVVSPNQTTTYSVTGSVNGCAATAFFAVPVTAAPAFSVSPDATLCPGKSATLSASGGYTAYSWNNVPAPGGTLVVTPTLSATYTVSATGAPGGCNSSSVVAITVTTNPVSIISTTNSYCNACTGAINVVSTGGTGPYIYSIQNSTCTVPCLSLCQGLYSLLTTDANGCVNPKFFSIECSGLLTGIKETTLENGMRLYPNSVKNWVTIEYLHSKFKYTLVNMLGQVVLKEAQINDKTTINLQGMSSGIYFVEVESGTEIIVRKLIVE